MSDLIKCGVIAIRTPHPDLPTVAYVLPDGSEEIHAYVVNTAEVASVARALFNAHKRWTVALDPDELFPASLLARDVTPQHAVSDDTAPYDHERDGL